VKLKVVAVFFISIPFPFAWVNQADSAVFLGVVRRMKTCEKPRKTLNQWWWPQRVPSALGSSNRLVIPISGRAKAT